MAPPACASEGRLTSQRRRPTIQARSPDLRHQSRHCHPDRTPEIHGPSSPGSLRIPGDHDDVDGGGDDDDSEDDDDDDGESSPLVISLRYITNVGEALLRTAS